MAPSPNQLSNKTIPPLKIIKKKKENDTSNNTSPTNSNTDIWETAVSKNIHLRSPNATSPPPKKIDKNIFISTNRFTPIAPNDEEERMDDTNDNIPDKNQTPKPPPIFIQEKLNFNNFCIKIKELTDSTGFDCKSSTNKLRLQTYSADSYRTVINYLKENNVSFHSYQSKELKAFRAVIRNLHPTTDLSFIKKELLDSGFTTRNIMPVFHKLTKTPLPIFFIDLEPGPTNADIFKITSLCYTIVKIEPAHPKRDIPQCHRSLISETHLVKSSTLKIHGYDIIRADHPDGTAHGGAALIISNQIEHSPLPPLRSCNIQSASTTLKINSVPISIASCYFPPGISFPTPELIIFLQSLSNSYILGADFNAKHQTWSRSTNTRGRALYNLITQKHLKVLSSPSPTYWPSHANRHPDTIDFFITNLPNRFTANTTNLNDPASDHTPVLLHIGAQPLMKPNRPTITPGFTNWNKFRDILSKKTILNIKLKSPSNIYSAINKLTYDIQVAAKDSSPLRPSNNPSPNLTPELRKLLADKRRARSIWQRTHYPEDKSRYNMLSNKLKSLLKIHKNNSYKNYLQNLSLKNGSLWRKTKSILRLKEITPPLQRPNNTLAVTDSEKADALANELSTVFIPHTISPPPLHLQMVTESLLSPLPMALPAKPTSPAEIRGIIKKLANGKSPGHDLITNKIIKNLPAKAIIHLTHIYNATLRLSYFPTTWKSSIIVTILKPGKPPENPSSYRPISLLPVLGKVLEKILLKRVTAIANEKKNLPNFQFGFRANHSTTHQLHRVADTISTALETKKYCAGVFLDVAKAFDTVWHDGLLFKLKTLFPAPYYLLLKSYLDNRTFMVRHNLQHSKQFRIAAGVPQGSDIAPFLYIIYTSDLPTSEKTTIGTYADDTALLSTADDHITASLQLQSHIDTLSKWFTKWKIKVNESKSSFVTFALRPLNCPPISMNNTIIPHSNEVKYLGLIFDRRLTWSSHLKDKRKKLNSRLHLLRPLLRSNLPLPLKLILYKTLLQPLWVYGVVIWGSAKQSNKRTIQAFQNICCRIITGAPWYISNNAINSDLRICSVNETATIYNKRFHAKLQSNSNQLIRDLATPALPGNPTRRLKRNWCRDLKI
ncbi:hypothetical protein QTP88_011222 [Uroleucon formosanum]